MVGVTGVNVVEPVQMSPDVAERVPKSMDAQVPTAWYLGSVLGCTGAEMPMALSSVLCLHAQSQGNRS